MLKKIVFKILRYSSIPFIIRNTFQKRKVCIAVYHKINENIAEKHFRVLSLKYNIISLKQFVNAYYKNELEKLPDRSLIITFDDGYSSVYNLATLFEKYNIEPCVFLCSSLINTNKHFWFEECNYSEIEDLKKLNDSDRIEKLKNSGFIETTEYPGRQLLNLNEINETKQIIDFQSHSLSHPILPYCSNEKSEKEIFQSKIELEKIIPEIFAFAYPNGDYSEREIEFVKKAGYKAALTVDKGFNSSKTDIFRLKRLNIGDEDSIDKCIVKASGFWDFFRIHNWGKVDNY